MRLDLAETIDNQDLIIRMQSRIIDKLFLQLLQYVDAEELDNSEIIAQINEVAKLKSDN